jgi:phosphate transport system substrate-binding protein
VGLLGARINTDQNSPQYLTQDLSGVYDNGDARAYPLSSYSYMVVPTAADGTFNNEKGRTLGAFAYYFLCEGQQQADSLGLLAAAHQPRAGRARRRPAHPGRRRAGDRHPQVQQPDLLGERRERARQERPAAACVRPEGRSAVHRRHRRRQGRDARQGRRRRRCGRCGRWHGGAAGGAAGAAAGPAGVAADGTPLPADGAADALALEGDPSLLDPSAVDGGLDPLVAAQGGVTGVPVSLEAREGWQMQNTLTLVALALLLALVVGPPLAWRRIAARTAATDASSTGTPGGCAVRRCPRCAAPPGWRWRPSSRPARWACSCPPRRPRLPSPSPAPR